MAERVDFWPNRKSRTKYPWEAWLDGSIWKLERYVDFHTSSRMFSEALRRGAHRRGKTLTTRADGKDILYIQAIGDKR